MTVKRATAPGPRRALPRAAPVTGPRPNSRGRWQQRILILRRHGHMGLLKSIRGDIQAAKDRDPAATSTLEVVFTYPRFHARQLHRLSHSLHRRGDRLPARLISHL